MTTAKHALLRMINLHNATDTTYPAFSVTSHRVYDRDCLAIEGSFNEIMSALCTALMNVGTMMNESDRADIKRAMFSARMHAHGTRTSEIYFVDVAFSVDAREHEHASACGRCDRCLFGERCELVSKD
jgi:hypothetical protein